MFETLYILFKTYFQDSKYAFQDVFSRRILYFSRRLFKTHFILFKTSFQHTYYTFQDVCSRRLRYCLRRASRCLGIYLSRRVFKTINNLSRRFFKIPIIFSRRILYVLKGCLERVSWKKDISSRRFRGVFKTSIFCSSRHMAFVIKTSFQDVNFLFTKTHGFRYQDAFSRRIQVFSRYIFCGAQDTCKIFKTPFQDANLFSRHLLVASWKFSKASWK